MTIFLNPYLNFRGNAREAMEFYRSVLGGELRLSTYAELIGDTGPEADQVMHSELRADNGLMLMGSDVPSHMDYREGNNAFSVSLSGDDEDALTGYWRKLSVGAMIGEELAKAPWGDSFGMLHDRFGVSWLVNISAAGAMPA